MEFSKNVILLVLGSINRKKLFVGYNLILADKIFLSLIIICKFKQKIKRINHLIIYINIII
jgi:hypothetical protein